MKFKLKEHIQLIKMIWHASRRDLLAAIPWFPIYSLAEVLLALASGVLLQVLFVTTDTVTVQSLIPGNFKSFFNISYVLNTSQLIFLVPVFIAVVGFIKLISRFMSSYLTERAGHRTSCHLREEMLIAYISSKGNKIDQVNPDHVANQLLQDSLLLQSALSKGTISSIRDAVVLLFIVASLLLISWKIFLIGILIGVPMLITLKKISQKLNFYGREGQKKNIGLATRFLESYHGNAVIQALRSHGREVFDFTELANENYKFIKKSLIVKTFFSPVMEFLGIAMLAGMFFWRMNTHLEFEGSNYSTMIILVVFSFRYIKNIAGTITFFSDMHVVFTRVTQYFKDYQPVNENNHLEYLPSYSKDAVIGKNISYTIDGDRKILDNCSVNIPKGKKVAFIGESGAGKTTLLRILAGLIIPNRGHIQICKHYRMAFQTPYLYCGTTQENILYNQTSEINSKIEKNCQDLVRQLNLAYTDMGAQILLNKNLGFLGEGLSGGEKARVALARILFGSPRLLLLDEPTANLDAASSRVFWQAVDKWKAKDSEHTVVAISHMIREVIDFDYCYIFENGKIVNSGVPRDILYHG